MSNKRWAILIVLWSGTTCFAGPYAPAVGQPGSTAVAIPDDPNVYGWADGWSEYVVGIEAASQWQTPEKALGVAKGDSFDIVSLGRGGQITLTFSIPIANGPGWDFATFENSHNDTFLELGYVEVSSDGVHFSRFVNFSLTQDPVGAFGNVDPTDITGYCSKYIQGYGTPFDLNDLAGIENLDITAVTHVRIVDIVGDETCFDSANNTIYDPYPTIGSAGVDLDAIGVIHQKTLSADVDGDGIVNLRDYAFFSTAYLSEPNDLNWNYKCDLQPYFDDVVNLYDMRVMADQWLQTEPWYNE